MVSFARHGTRSEYRVAGLCVHDEYVPLATADQAGYSILPGGKVEPSDDSRPT